MNSTETPILLIACGGNSQRMGRDKSQLDYYGKPQFEYLFDLLRNEFSEIYFSIQLNQVSLFESFENAIIDSEKYKGHGPISGLLSCSELHRNRSILYIGCDYPLLTLDDVKQLTLSVNVSSAFYNDFYEPLLALYSQTDLPSLEKEFNLGNYSLQSFLQKSVARKITPKSPERIKSIDTVEEYDKILSEIKNQVKYNSR